MVVISGLLFVSVASSLVNASSISLLLAMMASLSAANIYAGQNKTVYIGVIMDNETSLWSLTFDKALAIFNKAVSPENRRKTIISAFNNQTSIFSRQTSPAILVDNSTIEIKAFFMEPNYSPEMFRTLNEQQQLGNKFAMLLDIANCSPLRCNQLLELSNMLAGNLSITSACCYVDHNPDDETLQGPRVVYESIEAHSTSYLMLYLAKTYRWRRFHFVVTSNWPIFDELYKGIREAALEMAQGGLIVTHGFFCSNYLAGGNLCSANQAKDIVLNEATAIFLLLETQSDMPEFIRQVKEINKDDARLLRGKAFVIVHVTGVMTSTVQRLLENAPDGLMLMRQKRLIFDDYRPMTIKGMDAVGVDALLYAELRLMAKAIELFEQNRGKYTRVSDLFCGTAFNFTDSDDFMAYSEDCDRGHANTEVLNVKKFGDNSTNVDRVFLIKNGNLFQTGVPHWLGSGKAPPYEDFCKLDGANCPADLAPIITPTVIAFVVLSISLVFLVIVARRRARRRELEAKIVRDLVIIKFDEFALNAPSGKTTPMSKASSQTLAFDEASRRGSGAYSSDDIRGLPPEMRKMPRFVTSLRGEPVLVTTMSKRLPEVDDELIKELIQLRDLHHPNVNQFIGICPDDDRIFNVQALCSKGTLAAVLARQNVNLNRLFKISMANDVATGMVYLHQSRIRSHGRLTSENIYIDARWSCKIGSIPIVSLDPPVPGTQIIVTKGHTSSWKASLSKFLPWHHKKPIGCIKNDMTNSSLASIVLNMTNESSSEKTGEEINADFYWVAPELLQLPSIILPPRGTQAGDVYAFAIILSEIITRQKPFAFNHKTNKSLVEAIRNGATPICRPDVPELLFDDTLDLLEIARICWSEKPIVRPTFRTIVRQLQRINHGKKANMVDEMVAMMDSYTETLEETVAARTRELTEEKKRSEELLSKMLPKYVVEELKQGRLVHPEVYESVTVYFSDIVGFTALAADSSPMEIVQFLNDLYSEFDCIIGSYDVYKVETIGDAYMVASGLPKRNGNSHAGEIATMALDILSCVSTFQIIHRPERQLQLRIGIHSGPVVAGVVGLKMPRYCLFGDTVNYASRMESSGLALRIHVSPHTKSILDEIGGFQLVERGEVKMKGKGIVSTFFLIGKTGFNKPLPDLSRAARISEHEFK